MTQKEFLDSTIEYYSQNPTERRCVESGGTACKYSPENADKVGLSEGCAIGRHLSPEVQKILDNPNVQGYIAVSGYTVISRIFEIPSRKALLPRWMQNMDVEFLQSVQSLHDQDNNWLPTGLSVKGQEEVEKIRAQYNLS